MGPEPLTGSGQALSNGASTGSARHRLRSAPMDITLLGPQRRVAGARTAVADLIPEGPVAAINAGWRERESDTAELDAVLGGRMVNLELYRRWQQLTESDPPYADAERRLTANLEDLRGAYQLRLRHALAAVRAVSQRVGNDPVRVAARSDAVAGVRALDAWHIDRSAELRHAFYGEVGLGERPSVTDHRQSVARLLGDSAGLVVAGGHVGVLLHLLHVFGLAGVLRVDRPGDDPPKPPRTSKGARHRLVGRRDGPVAAGGVVRRPRSVRPSRPGGVRGGAGRTPTPFPSPTPAGGCDWPTPSTSTWWSPCWRPTRRSAWMTVYAWISSTPSRCRARPRSWGRPREGRRQGPPAPAGDQPAAAPVGPVGRRGAAGR